MLTIRKEQLYILGEHSWEQAANGFEQLALACWPAVAGDVTQVDLRARIVEAMHQAVNYGFSTRYDMQRYVNLTLALGRDFHKNPNLPWAGVLLREQEQDARTRMDRLCALCRETLLAGNL